MFSVMIVERNKYNLKGVATPQCVESFEDLMTASSAMYKLMNLVGKHYHVYIVNTHKCEEA